MFGIAGTAELSTFCPGTGTWNRLQDGIVGSMRATTPSDNRKLAFADLVHIA